jgi:hypothetical protein
VFEDQVVGAVDFDDHRKPIEALDACVKLTPVEKMKDDPEPIASGTIEKDVLDVGLSG